VAGLSNQSGCFNLFFGDATGFSHVSGDNNIFLGQAAGFNDRVGINNTMIGLSAGITSLSGANNIIFGTFADVSVGTLSGVIVLGAGAVATQSFSLAIGSTSTPLSGTIFGNLAATATSQALSTVGGTSDDWNANIATFTQNLSVFGTVLTTTGVNWIPTLSGTLPGAEITKRVSTSRGKIRGKIFYNFLNSGVTKNIFLRFANNNIFTDATNIIDAGNANQQTWIRTFEGILLPGNQFVFGPAQSNVEDGTRNNPFTTYGYTPGDPIYYQVGVSIGSVTSEFVAISGGYVSIVAN
jgi:hypothetical protein